MNLTPATIPSSTPSPAPASRRAGRPRVYADPLPGQEPTPAQHQRQRRRELERQAYHEDPVKSKAKDLRWYAAHRAARASMIAHLAELEAQAADTATAAKALLRIVNA